MEGVGHLLLRLLVSHHNGVTGVVTASTSGADIGFSSQDIGKFALSFVSPLCAESGERKSRKKELVVSASNSKGLRCGKCI